MTARLIDGKATKIPGNLGLNFPSFQFSPDQTRYAYNLGGDPNNGGAVYVDGKDTGLVGTFNFNNNMTSNCAGIASGCSACHAGLGLKPEATISQAKIGGQTLLIALVATGVCTTVLFFVPLVVSRVARRRDGERAGRGEEPRPGPDRLALGRSVGWGLYFAGLGLGFIAVEIVIEAIEEAMGRKRVKGKRWGSRIIDLDILLWNQEVVQKKNLKIPHPEISAPQCPESRTAWALGVQPFRA